MNCLFWIQINRAVSVCYIQYQGSKEKMWQTTKWFLKLLPRSDISLAKENYMAKLTSLWQESIFYPREESVCNKK
jgi:hypothetical protein